MKHSLAAGGTALFALVLAHAHAANTAPRAFQHPLRIIVPFAPSGGQDTTARILGAKLSEIAGQPVVIDNRPGGAGVIAGEATLKAPPDGHTVYLASTSFVVTPSLRKTMPFDPVRDFAPITRISSSAGALCVNAALPVHDVRELIALAKRRPGEVTFGSAGVGASSHLSGELFKALAGVDIVHVPYKGSAPAMTALIGGEIVMGVFNTVSAIPHVKAGRLRMLGVTTAKRSVLLPDVPTIAEAGVPGFENTIWNGILAHDATPASMQTALHDAFARVIESAQVKAKLLTGGAETFSGDTPAAYAAFIAAEIAKWAKIVRSAGIEAM